MIIPATSTGSAYDTGDPYATDNQYGSSGLTSGRYGDQYGTGTYSEYRTSRGRYSTGVEIAGYGTESGSGYRDLSTDSYRYGDGQDAIADAGSLDYVIDVLEGDLEQDYTTGRCCT